MTADQHATLSGGLRRSRGPATSAVLVLHGGQEQSLMPTTPFQPAVLRMLDLYVGTRRQARHAAVYLLRHRVRGWNLDPAKGPEPDPVADARRALDRITGQHPGVKVALLGHSMGGRTAFRIADDPRVVGVCGLAPWLPEGEPLVEAREEQQFVIAHGTADRMTSAPASLHYAERLLASGAAVARFELAGERHALLAKPVLWHRFAVRVSLGLAGDAALPAAVSAALHQPGPVNLRLPLDDTSYR